MSGMIGTVITLAVLGIGGYFLWINKDEILAGLKSGGAAPVSAVTPDPAAAGAATAGEYAAPAGGYKAPAGGYKAPKGGYNGTPGWYTEAGHHHCVKGAPGCICTDPKKCLGKSGTGHEICADGSCAPGPGQCRPDKGRYGAGPCGDCPPGTGGGACAGGGGGGGAAYKAPKKGKYARAMSARAYETTPIDELTYNGLTKRRIGYYDALFDDDDNLVEYLPSTFALTNERMSCW